MIRLSDYIFQSGAKSRRYSPPLQPGCWVNLVSAGDVLEHVDRLDVFVVAGDRFEGPPE